MLPDSLGLAFICITEDTQVQSVLRNDGQGESVIGALSVWLGVIGWQKFLCVVVSPWEARGGLGLWLSHHPGIL